MFCLFQDLDHHQEDAIQAVLQAGPALVLHHAIVLELLHQDLFPENAVERLLLSLHDAQLKNTSIWH